MTPTYLLPYTQQLSFKSILPHTPAVRLYSLAHVLGSAGRLSYMYMYIQKLD